MSLKNRLQALEQQANPEPLPLIMSVDECPTDEQQAAIDEAVKTGGRGMVFVAKGNTAWLFAPGVSIPPPWLNDVNLECNQ